MKILLVTDAWAPQTNGVVTTYTHVIENLTAAGHDVVVIEPRQFPTSPLPGYAEIRIAATPWRVGAMIDETRADAIHIATEGPLGLAARRHLTRRGTAFTTALHTKFPEYVNARLGLPLAVGYRFMGWFHGAATRTLVTTPSHKEELEAWGLDHLTVWGRGVDTRRFRPGTRPPRRRHRLLYVGRVAVEKNIEGFLELPVDAHKVIVGDGPSRDAYQRRYPDVEWAGYRFGEQLVSSYADADVFVFPSRTDTFGLVMLEAMACGTPVAAFPVTGPKDVILEGTNGALDEDLGKAIHRALQVPRESCRAFALANDWGVVAQRFVSALAGKSHQGA